MGLAAAVAIYLLLHNALVVGARVPPGARVVLHLGVGAGLVAVGGAAGLTLPEMGLAADAAVRGLAWGAAASVGMVGAAAAALAIPRTKKMFHDRRIAGLDRGELAFRLLVQIPIATALFEEVAFRGVLLASMLEIAGRPAAVLASSAVFGLWHIAPALERLRVNRPGAGAGVLALEVAFTVLITTVGGVLFCLLRLESGSVVAPTLAHMTANVAATVAARRVTR